jgi:hypothetical protein
MPLVPTASPGVASIIGFGQDGVVIMRNDATAQPSPVIEDFGQNVGGWCVDKHVRLVADVTGDRTADLIGFGDNGVLISFNNGNDTFAKPVKNVLADFGYSAGGWRVEKHIRYLADIRNAGWCDIVGFGDDGVVVSRNEGNAQFKPVHIALKDFGYNAGGWRLDRHLRFLGDTTGDGLPDIVGFGEKSVFISRNQGDGTFAPAQSVLDDFCYSAGGWRVGEHPRFIADLTGNRKVDIIGCGADGVYVSLNKGDGTFGPVTHAVRDFGTAQGWIPNWHPRFIADLTNDKRGDIVGFGWAGVTVAYNNGDGTFQPSKLMLKDFGVRTGWHPAKHPRFVVDLTGNGCADIIGFGETGVYVAYNDGKGEFGPVRTLTRAFAYNNGEWAETVRWLANLDQQR